MEYNITLIDFVNTLYPELPENEVVCLAKPSSSGFSHCRATERKLKQIKQKPDEYYLCVSRRTATTKNGLPGGLRVHAG